MLESVGFGDENDKTGIPVELINRQQNRRGDFRKQNEKNRIQDTHYGIDGDNYDRMFSAAAR